MKISYTNEQMWKEFNEYRIKLKFQIEQKKYSYNKSNIEQGKSKQM